MNLFYRKFIVAPFSHARDISLVSKITISISLNKFKAPERALFVLEAVPVYQIVSAIDSCQVPFF